MILVRLQDSISNESRMNIRAVHCTSQKINNAFQISALFSLFFAHCTQHSFRHTVANTNKDITIHI
jgi:hypothetical protein